MNFKVDSNEKWGGSGRRLSLRFSLGLWRWRVICNLNMLLLCKENLFSLSACYSLINKRFLGEYARPGQNDPLSYNSTNILAHLIYFWNKWCQVNPPKNLQNFSCSNIHPENLIRLADSRNDHFNCLNIHPANSICLAYSGNEQSFRQYMGAWIGPVVHAFPIVTCRVLPM